MGFRTVLITEDCYLDYPEWFREKWGKQYHFGAHSRTDGGIDYTGSPMASKFERKYYGSKEEEIFTDLQKVLNEQTDSLNDFEIVLFHECLGVTKVHIGKDFIRMYEPSEWHEVDEITHNYCYGCSTPEGSDMVLKDPAKDTEATSEPQSDTNLVSEGDGDGI